MNQFDYTVKKNIGFCEACIGGRHHRNPFETRKSHTTAQLELVHSDICGKMGEKSNGGAEYFLTFVDDYSRYSWVYTLKKKVLTMESSRREIQWEDTKNKSEQTTVGNLPLISLSRS